MKKLLFSLMSLFAIGLVMATAGYLVSSFVITTDVYEPFETSYAIMGNGGNWDGESTCDEYTGEWIAGTNVDVGGLYAGEGRMVCVRIDNVGEGAIDYTFSGEVVSGNGNLVECEYAFGSPSVSGTAEGSSITMDGVAVIVAGDATPVEDCEVTLSLTRNANTV